MKLTWLETASVLMEEDDTFPVFDLFPGIPYRYPEIKIREFQRGCADPDIRKESSMIS